MPKPTAKTWWRWRTFPPSLIGRLFPSLTWSCWHTGTMCEMTPAGRLDGRASSAEVVALPHGVHPSRRNGRCQKCAGGTA